VSDEKSLASPKLYVPGQLNRLFNRYTFSRKLFHGTVTSCLLFFIPFGIYKEATNSDGISADMKSDFAIAVGAILVIVVNLQVFVDFPRLCYAYNGLKSEILNKSVYLNRCILSGIVAKFRSC